MTMDEYFARPWTTLRNIHASSTWWLQLLEQEDLSKVAHDYPIVQLVRNRLLSFSMPVDQWVLRIIFGNHPLIALHSWQLVLARAKGICRRQPKELSEPIERSVTPTLPSLPQRAGSPETSKKKGAVIVYKQFTDGFGSMNDREFFELEDSDDLGDDKMAEMNQVLDLIELLKLALVRGPLHLFEETIAYLFSMIEKPEGKHQRLKMQHIVMRSVGVLAYFLACERLKTQQAVLKCFQGSSERAEGSIMRVAYYNPSAKVVAWLKDHLLTESLPLTSLENEWLQLISGQIPAEQIRLGSSRDYEAIYRRVCISSHLVYPLESEIHERIQAGETDTNFVAIVLCLAYHRPESFEQLAREINAWKSKMLVRDARVDAFLDATSLAMSLPE